MLGFHAFTGSNMCGGFAGRIKEWCFKVFMSCDDEILEALASLGNNDPSPETCTQFERFIGMLYRSKVCIKVNELRWFLYSNRAVEGESHPCLPSPAGYGCNFNADADHFVLCLNQPAPEAIIN